MTKEKENKEPTNINRTELKQEAEKFLNEFNDNIPHATSGIGSFIREDEESDTWFFGETEQGLLLNYALLASQLADYLEVNVFDLLLDAQLRLAGVFTEEYDDFVKGISDMSPEPEASSKKI